MPIRSEPTEKKSVARDSNAQVLTITDNNEIFCDSRADKDTSFESDMFGDDGPGVTCLDVPYKDDRPVLTSFITCEIFAFLIGRLRTSQVLRRTRPV